MALNTAMELFWAKGYEGTTLTDLTDAIGIKRASLYAVFGSKEELFRRARDLYDTAHMGFVRLALGKPSTREAVDELLHGFADAQTDPSRPPGCLGLSGAFATSSSGEPIRQEMIACRMGRLQALRARLEEGHLAGDLPPDSNPSDLAHYLMTIINGMAVHAATGATREDLHRIVDTALTAWPASEARRVGRSRKRAAMVHQSCLV
jgi:AcrR family transcriptional regulator